MLVGNEAECNGHTQETSSESEPSPPPRVLLILGSILERLVARNDRLVEVGGSMGGNGVRPPGLLGSNLKVFDGVRAPSISIGKYLERLYKYTNCSPSCFVVGFVYMDRLVHRHPELLVVSLNVHRLLVTSLLVASKMFDDVQYDNAFYARIGGVSNPELNRLELELLFLLDFDVTVTSTIFESYCWHLEKEMLRCSNNVATEIDKVPLLSEIISDGVNGISIQER